MKKNNREPLALAVMLALTVTSLSAAEFPAHPSLFVHYTADAPGNIVAAPLSVEFTVGDADLKAGKLPLPELGFGPLSYPKGLGNATPVYFSTTGKLPAPLTADTPYYLAPAPGGGYKIFAAAADADAALQPGGVVGEKVLPAQNAQQGVGALTLTDTGGGTHTLRTKPLLGQFTDLTPNGFHSLARRPSDKQTMLELDADRDGRKFVRTAGALSRENWMGSYSGYGPTFYQGPSGKRQLARQQSGGKRVMWQIFVARVRSFKERQVVKFLAGPELVNAADNQIAYGADHRMVSRVATGDLVLAKAYPGGKLPAPLTADRDYYARRVDKKNLTLHLTPEDAAAGANAVDLTDSGAGECVYWCPERVGDNRRWSFFIEVLAPDSGGNTLSPRLQEPVAQQGGGLLKIAQAFTVSGDGNGNVSGLAGVPDLMPVSFWTPPRAALPPPLTAGTRYWASRAADGDRVVRLHTSLESAQKARGVPTAGADCVKFSGGGRGEALAAYDDGASAVMFGVMASKAEQFKTRVPFEKLCVLVFKVDYNDPSAGGITVSLGVNAAKTETLSLPGQKGLTPAALNESFPAWTLFNSAQGHVPMDMDLYEFAMGSSADDVPDAWLQTAVDWLKKKYAVE